MMKKKVICLALAVCLIVSVVPVSASASEPFTDVPSGSWYCDAVEYVYDRGLFGGTGSGKFSPASPMTRAMFVKVLANKTSNYDDAYYKQRYSYYSDVPMKSWMSPSIRWASDARIVGGTGATTFSPNKALTREEMAVMLYNYAEMSGNNTSFDGSRAKGFSDYSSVSSWAKKAMEWAVDQAVLKGSNNLLNPKGKATRAEVAQVFMNADSLLVHNTVSMEESEPTKANIAMLFSRAHGLNMGKLALEYNFSEPVYIANSPYPDYNYRVIGMNGFEEIESYLSSFLSPEVLQESIGQSTVFEGNGACFTMVIPHGATEGYNAASVQIESGNDDTYYVSIDQFTFGPTRYSRTNVMEISLLDGDYKISQLNSYSYRKANPNSQSLTAYLPHYLQYKIW